MADIPEVFSTIHPREGAENKNSNIKNLKRTTKNPKLLNLQSYVTEQFYFIRNSHNHIGVTRRMSKNTV